MYLIDPRKNQYKANLHCHSTCSDGKLTPQQLKQAYKDHGYHVLCISDHEATNDFTAMSEPDFLMLTGYEAYIRPNYVYDRYGPEVHLNLLARDPHNVSLVYYHPVSSRYLSPEQHASIPKVGPLVEREYTVEFINEFIRVARENGYLVTYNHPVWSMESEERIMAYQGWSSLEICNYGSWTTNNQEYNGALYDKLLRSGKRIFAHSADDNHNKVPFDDPKNDSFGGAAIILADRLEYGGIFGAIEKGEMYSSMGPVFHEVSFDGEQVRVSCSDVVSIQCHDGSKAPVSIRAEAGKTLNSAVLPVRSDCPYIRISIMDKNGKYADTRGWFRDELGLPPL